MYSVKVRKTRNHGRGVYATKNFIKGEIIEKCPVLEIPPVESLLCQKTILDNYLYDWKEVYKSCLPLGYGLIYNHSYRPNARYSFDFTRKLIIYKAIRPIAKGREITVNYNFYPDDTSPTDVTDIPHDSGD
jgi:SET domain-containing protein